jgi:hypothetical protein
LLYFGEDIGKGKGKKKKKKKGLQQDNNHGK